MIEASLRTFILSIPGVASYLGGGPTSSAARLWPVKLPPNPAYPAMTYFCVSMPPRDRTTSGPSGFATKRVQFDIWRREASDVVAYGEAKLVARKIRRVLDGYVGPLVAGGDEAFDVRIENERDGWDDNVKAYSVGFDVLVDFDEGAETD